jgi:hypothetical protein
MVIERALTWAVVATIGCTPAFAAGRNINKRQARHLNRERRQIYLQKHDQQHRG